MTNCTGRTDVAIAVALVALLVSPKSASAACSTSAPCASAPQDLGTLGGNYSSAYGISADGLVIVGQASDAQNNAHATIWQNGMATGIAGTREAYGVSDDGRVIVGAMRVNGSLRAYRWYGGGLANLGTLGGTQSLANAVSGDGLVVVGGSDTAGPGVPTHAFRWVGGVMHDLGTFAGGFTSEATATNIDGSVVTGYSSTASNDTHAFRWQNGAMTDLGTLGGASSVGQGISSDGSVIVGWSNIANGELHAARWQGSNISDLGTLGGTNASASAVSGNGAIAVGTSLLAGDTVRHAFRWTSATGMRDMNTLLANAGVNMNGITLANANAITRDGRFIVGDGDFNGSDHAWLALYDDGAGGLIAGVSTAAAQQASLNDVAAAHVGVMAEQHGLLAILLGNDKPLTNDSHVGAFAYGGSFGAGAFGQLSSSAGLTLLGGVSYNQEDYDTSSIADGVSGAAAVRYAPLGASALSPFMEVGGWVTRGASMSFDRTYANGAGSATGSGDVHGDLSYLYAKAGLILKPSETGQIVGAAEFGRESLETGSYSETAGASNPFNASFSAGHDVLDIAKIRMSWSEALMPNVDMTIWAAGAWAYDSDTNVTASITGFGTMKADPVNNSVWAECGARIGYKVTDKVIVDAFTNSIAGSTGIDASIHSGVDVRARF